MGSGALITTTTNTPPILYTHNLVMYTIKYSMPSLPQPTPAPTADPSQYFILMACQKIMGLSGERGRGEKGADTRGLAAVLFHPPIIQTAN